MRACNGPASTTESTNVPSPVHIIVSHQGKPAMPMFDRVECVFVLRASIRCMNDYTWRRRRRLSSHAAHRQIRHPVDPHAPSLPSLFGTFMLAIESPNEDLGRGTSRRNKHLRLRFRWARPGRLGRVPGDVGYIYRSVALWRTKKSRTFRPRSKVVSKNMQVTTKAIISMWPAKKKSRTFRPRSKSVVGN